MGLPRPDKSGLAMTGKTDNIPPQPRKPTRDSPKSPIDKLIRYAKLYLCWGKVDYYALIGLG